MLLIYYGLVAPNGHKTLGQRQIVTWRYQAITRTNVPIQLIRNMFTEIPYLKSLLDIEVYNTLDFDQGHKAMGI